MDWEIWVTTAAMAIKMKRPATRVLVRMLAR